MSAMRVFRVDPKNHELLSEVIRIHDEMPLAWDPSHSATSEELEAFRTDILSEEANTGIWILSEENPCSPGSVRGMIWVCIKKSKRLGVACNINSFWIHPAIRGEKHALQLTDACVSFARELGATSLQCSTHFTNSRMRQILEKHAFKPGMLQYSLDL